MTISADDRDRIIFAARFSIYSNSLLVGLKLVVGFFTFSISVISEAIHSGTDLAAAIVANYSVRKSTKPADDSHKFGHGKYESYSGTIEAYLILVAAAIIIYESIFKLINVEAVSIVEAGIVVMGFSAVLNFFISRYLMRVAKRYQSLALEADALHLKTDVWTSLGVFAGLIVVWTTGFQWIDPVAAMFVAAIIIRVAIDLTRKSARELLDHSLTQEEERVIHVTIHEVTGEVATYHGLRTRRSGRERFVDFHLVLPKSMPLDRAHSICDQIEIRLMAALPDSNMTIHIEPCDEKCETCTSVKICKERK